MQKKVSQSIGFLKCSVVAVLMAGAGCAMADDSNREPLRVGTESTYAPFEFTEHGQLMGFDIDLMNAVAKAVDQEIEWVPMSFDGLIPALLTGQLDIAVASFTKTPERAKRIDFTDPYYRSGLSFVIRGADKEKYVSGESLQGQRLCAQLGSVSAKEAERLSPQKVTTFSDASGSYMELMAGGCEAVLNDRPVHQYFLKTKGQSHGLVEIDELFQAEDMAMVVPKNKDEIRERLNQGLAEIKANGLYDEIYKKWFVFDNGVERSQAELKAAEEAEAAAEALAEQQATMEEQSVDAAMAPQQEATRKAAAGKESEELKGAE